MSYYNNYNNNRWDGRKNYYNNNNSNNYRYYDESDSDDSDSSDSSDSDSDDNTNNNNNKQQQQSNLQIKVNKSGYRQYYSSNEGKWNFTHRTVAEKKIGRPIQNDEHVHHINKNKTDNRPHNLVVIKENIHRELHKSKKNEKECCFNCGRKSHWSSNCFAKTDVHGNFVIGDGGEGNT